MGINCRGVIKAMEWQVLQMILPSVSLRCLGPQGKKQLEQRAVRKQLLQKLTPSSGKVMASVRGLLQMKQRSRRQLFDFGRANFNWMIHYQSLQFQFFGFINPIVLNLNVALNRFFVQLFSRLKVRVNVAPWFIPSLSAAILPFISRISLAQECKPNPLPSSFVEYPC